MTEKEQKVAQLTAEKASLETSHPLAAKLLQDEIDRTQSGGLENLNFIELHQPKTKVEFRVKIPVKEFPQVNFVGKILGQGGENVKRLQEATGCRIAVLGRGSMKDKGKQEELRQQGGKYSHLNHDLHVWFESVGHPIDCYQRIAHAFRLVHPFLVPDPNDLQQMQQQQQQNGMMRGGRGGGPRGRGGPRGAPSRGGPGGMGRGAGGPPRGGLGRGAPPQQGSMLGGGGMGGGMGSPLGGGMGGGFGGQRPQMRGGAPAARGGRGQMPTRGAGRGAGGMGRGSMSMRGRGGGSAPSMVPPPSSSSYGTESYDYETGAGGGYGSGYSEDVAAPYEEPAAVSGYGTAPAEASDPYGQYEGYGQAEESGYGAYETGAGGWGPESAGEAAGYGKSAPPTRGGLANYRTRPY